MRWGREWGLIEAHLRIWGQSIPRSRRGACSGRSTSSLFQLIIGNKKVSWSFMRKTWEFEGSVVGLGMEKQADICESYWRRMEKGGSLVVSCCLGYEKERGGLNRGLFPPPPPPPAPGPSIISHRPWWSSVWSESRLWVWKLHRKMRSRWRTAAKLAAKILQAKSWVLSPVPRSPHHSSNAQRGKSNDFPFLQTWTPYETFPDAHVAAATTRTKTTTPFLIFISIGRNYLY